MGLVQELFVTAFVAIVLSFLVAKLVSMVISCGGGGDVGYDSGKNVDCDAVIMEEAKFDRGGGGGGGLRVESTGSKRRVRFVEGLVKTVDQFEDCKSIQVEEISQVLVFKESCESADEISASDRIAVEAGLSEKSPADANIDGLVVEEMTQEGIKAADEFDGVNEENIAINGLDGLVVEEIIVQIAKSASNDDVVPDQTEEVRGEERMENQRSGIEVEVSKGEEKEEGLGCDDVVVADHQDGERRGDQRSEIEVGVSKWEEKEEELGCAVDSDDVVTDQGEERRGNQRSGVEVEVSKGEEKEELGCDEDVDDDVADQNEERRENQRSGIEVEVSKGEEKEELSCDEDVDDDVADQNDGRRENQRSGVEVEVSKGEEKEELGCDEDVDDPNEEIRGEERGENQGSGIEVGLNKGEEEKEDLDCDEDDDWEGIEKSELEKIFAVASNYVGDLWNNDRLENVGSDVQMQLYGLHKVAMEGPCYEPQPMALKVTARAKWNAWQRLGNMSPEVAMEQYITLISDKVPGWMESDSAGDGKQVSSEAGIPGAPHSDMSKCLHNQLNPEEDSKLDMKCSTGGGELAG